MAGVKGMRHTKKRNDRVMERIQVARIVNRLENHIFGEVKMENSAVTAALGLLKKKLPDLAATQVTGDADKPLRLTVSWES